MWLAQGHTAREAEAILESWGVWALYTMQTALHPATRGVIPKNKAYYVTPQLQTLQWLPIALGMKIKSSLAVSRPCLLHPPFVPHFPWLSAHCCTGPLCSQNISSSCSYHRAFVPTTSPTWSTLLHPPLIHPHLINFGSSKHLLQKAHPDCHPWSTPPLSPPRYINPMAAFPLLICLCEYLTHICSSN